MTCLSILPELGNITLGKSLKKYLDKVYKNKRLICKGAIVMFFSHQS